MHPPQSLPALSSVIDTQVTTTDPPYDELSQQLAAHTKLVLKLTRELDAEQGLCKTNTSFPPSTVT
jgi:hypothetical protein